MLSWGVLCHVFGVLCNQHNHLSGQAVWPRVVPKYTESYVGPSVQLLLYIVNILEPRKETAGSFNIPLEQTLGNETRYWLEGAPPNGPLSNEDKLAMVQIMERMFLDDISEFFTISVHWNSSSESVELQREQSFMKKGKNYLKTKASLSKITNQESDKDDDLLSDIFNGNEEEIQNILHDLDTFLNLTEMHNKRNYSLFKELVDSFDLNPDSIKSDEPNINLLFDEFLQLFEQLQDIFESLEIESEDKTNERLKFENKAQVSDLIRVLDIPYNYSRIEIKTYLKTDLEFDNFVEMEDLMNSLKFISKFALSDQLYIPLKMGYNQNIVVFSLPSIVEAVLNEELKTSGDVKIEESILKFGKIPNDFQISTKGRNNWVHRKIEEELTKLKVPLVLKKLCNMLITEAKVRRMNFLQGYSTHLINALVSQNFSTSAQQLEDTLRKMIERRDIVWPPAILLSKFIIQEIKKSNTSDIRLALQLLQPLTYTNPSLKPPP